MKNLFFLFLSFAFINSIAAQKLSGLWYAADSTRTYEIKETTPGNLEAVIKSSERKDDTVGFAVIKNLKYNSNKKRYEGTIYAVADGQPAFVKIKFDKNNPNRLILKIDRMFVFDIAIDWIKADTKNTSAFNGATTN